MKGKMKKLVAFALTTIMVLAMGITASAVDSKKGGSATITISNSAKGETYTFYKVFDARMSTPSEGEDAQITSYTLPIDAKPELKSALANSSVFTEANGTIVVNEGANNAAVFAEIKGWIEEEYITSIFETYGVGGSLEVTNLPYGYYYITSGVDTTVMVDNTNPDMTIIDKNSSKPDWPNDNGDPKGKVIIVDDQVVDNTTAAIGETVTYQIRVNTTNYEQDEDDKDYKQIANYTITDSPSKGITIQNITSVKVVEGTKETTINKQTQDNPTGYTVVNTVGQNLAEGFSLTLPWVSGTNNTSIYDNNAQIIIEYTAVVNEGAGTTNTNKATFTWDYVDGGTPTDTPETEETAVYTYSFDLVKTNAQNVVLTGAVFELYASNPDDGETGLSPLAFVLEDGGAYRLALDEDTEKVTEIPAGNVNIKGLNGTATYWLKEKTAPTGYNKLESAIEVKKAVPGEGATAEQILATYTNNATVTNGTYSEGGIEVENLTGSLLPSTGGIGTTIFYVVGGILVIGAGILLITKKRMGKNN